MLTCVNVYKLITLEPSNLRQCESLFKLFALLLTIETCKQNDKKNYTINKTMKFKINNWN